MHVLIVKTSALGDVVQALPVAAYLHKKGCRIDWVVEPLAKDLLEACPFVNRVYVIEPKKWRQGDSLSSLKQWIKAVRQISYDVVFDLQGNIKSALLLLAIKAKDKVGYALKSAPEWPNVFATTKRMAALPGYSMRQEYLSFAKRYFDDRSCSIVSDLNLLVPDEIRKKVLDDLSVVCNKHKVLVCPASRWKNKKLTKEIVCQALASFDKKGTIVFIAWGNEQEKVEAEQMADVLPLEVQVMNKLTLLSLYYFMKQMDLIITADSLTLHLAGLTKTKIWAYFGPSSGKKYAPEGEYVTIFQGSCPYGVHFDKRCPHLRRCQTGLCIKNHAEQ